MTDSSGRQSPAGRPADSPVPVITSAGGPEPARRPDSPPALHYQRIALVDLLDRVLAGGVVVMGEVRLAIADVDLVTISVRALISSVSSVLGDPAGDPASEDRPPPEGWADDR